MSEDFVEIDFFEERTAEQQAKDSRDIKSKLKVHEDGLSTYIIAIAVSHVKDENTVRMISTALGEPICPVVHDLVRDVYSVTCYDYLELGQIEVGFYLTMEDVEGWETHLPIPFSTVKRYLDQSQRASFETWKSKFGKDKFFIKFLQFKSVF